MSAQALIRTITRNNYAQIFNAHAPLSIGDGTSKADGLMRNVKLEAPWFAPSIALFHAPSQSKLI